MLNNEKKSTKLWGLISEDCQIKNKFKDTKRVINSIPIVGKFLRNQYYKQKYLETNDL